MVKIQAIEKLFLYILTYSYLLLPLVFLFSRSKRRVDLFIGIYGILFFVLLFLINPSNRLIPIPYIKIYQTFYTFSEYLFFTYILFQSIIIKQLRIIILIFSILFICFLAYDYLNNRHGRIDSLSVGIESILVFIYITFFFYQTFKSVDNEYIFNQAGFWLSLGILIYLGGTFFFNILANDIDETHTDKYWFLTYIADTIKNLLFCVSIIVYARNRHKQKLPPKSVPYLDLDMN